jgi:hypothetical protein
MNGLGGSRTSGLALARKGMLAGAVCALGAVASLAGAAPAMAGIQQEFAVFADCPVSTPGVESCVYSKVTGGEFTLGAKTVPIDKTVILQGGTRSGSAQLVPAADGETLSRTALTVPGGLVGIEGLGGEVTATAELAGTVEVNPINLLESSGTAVSLPLMVKLDNPFLGNGCYIGSSKQPVSVQLTTGTTSPPPPNKPITGSVAHFTYAGGGEIVVVPSSSLVDNAFSVPGASGCGGLLFLVVDPLVDLSAGVPAAAGHNTAIMNGSLETATVAAVEQQRALPEIGRCEPAGGTGSYSDAACTEEQSNGTGKYEWQAGAAKSKFTSSGKMTIEGAAGGQVKCKGSAAGEYVGTKSVDASLRLTGCKRLATKATCQSSGAAPGEIVASGLTGSLGFITEEAHESEVIASVGLNLSHEPSLLSAACGGSEEALTVKGSFIAPIAKADKMTSSFTVTAKASSGKQQPEAFEVGPKDTLTATMGSGVEPAGVNAKQKIANEEPLEIRAVVK